MLNILLKVERVQWVRLFLLKLGYMLGSQSMNKRINILRKKLDANCLFAHLHRHARLLQSLDCIGRYNCCIPDFVGDRMHWHGRYAGSRGQLYNNKTMRKNNGFQQHTLTSATNLHHFPLFKLVRPKSKNHLASIRWEFTQLFCWFIVQAQWPSHRLFHANRKQTLGRSKP